MFLADLATFQPVQGFADIVLIVMSAQKCPQANLAIPSVEYKNYVHALCQIY